MYNLHLKSGLLWQAVQTFFRKKYPQTATSAYIGVSNLERTEILITQNGGKMAKITTQKYLSRALAFALILLATQVKLQAACGNLTPSFSNASNKTCGLPQVITLTNTSTGNSRNVATYKWYVGSTLLSTQVGKSTQKYTINTAGSYTFKLVAIDTGKVGCKDSTSTTITISASVPRILDGNGVNTYSPIWENCISTLGAPDTFGITIKPQDSLRNYTIVWGDGTGNSTGTLLLSSQSRYHKYNSLGQFNVLIIGSKGSCTDTIRGVVSNERNPVAGIVGPPTGTNAGCVPIKMRFVNNSSLSSPSTTFTWDFGNGETLVKGYNTYKDTLYYTYKRFLCNGIVKLTQTNSCGSSSATWNPIMASSKDSAIIAPTNPTNCNLALPFTFNNTSENRFCSTPNSKKYKWIWGDGTNSGWITSSASQSKTYSKRGVYQILLIDSNGCGKDTGKYTLRIDSMPTISASPASAAGCSPLLVNFRDNSTNATSRNWNFGDATPTSNAQNPSHTYQTGGTYKAVLTVANNCGSLKDTIEITVKQKVKANFNNPITGCAPLTQKWTNTSVKGLAGNPTYFWDFGDGTTSTQVNPPDKTYSTLGTYTVTLIATDSCGKDTIKKTFTVRGKPSATITLLSTSKCVGSTLDIRFVTTPVNTASVIWGDGTNGSTYNGVGGIIDRTVSRKYDSLRTYRFGVIMADPSGCRDTNYLNIAMDPKPTMNYTYTPTNGCGPLDVTFTNTSVHNGGGNINQMKFLWSFSNGTLAYSKDTAARFLPFKTRDSIYPVKLVGTNTFGCKDSITKTVRVYPKPLSKFSISASEGCAPLNITTTNNSTPYDTGSINIMKFIWDFGNGRMAYGKDTAARFLASKTQDTVYNVRLIAISEHGCRDTSATTVRIYPKPKASFTRSVTEGCRPLVVTYVNQSVPYDTGDISIMSFAWDLGNRITSAATEPVGTYNDAINNDTTYNVRLIAISEHGCRDTATSSVLLHPDPVVRFDMSRTNGCGPLPVNFTNRSINGEKFTWEFGVYGTDTTKSPNKVFYGRDIFDSIVVVKLSAVSKFGCLSDTITDKVTVFGLPIANYLVSTDTFCFPDLMQFLNQSLASYNYTWDLGDGTVTSTTNPKHFFKKSASPFSDTTYFIKLVATSPYGCKDTMRGSMTVLPYPIPKFSVDNPAGCAPHTVQFTNQSVNVLNYLWVFGDGYTSTDVNPTHTFINTGANDTAYQVVLYTYSLDCVDSTSIWIPVYKPSYSFFRTDRVNPCDAGYFKFQSFGENAPVVKYNFGDGTSSSLPDLTHLFPTSPYNDTSFTVTLYTTSNRGCTDSFKRTVTLPQRLSIGMKDTSYALCAPAVINFVNYTRGARTYIWDFGDNGGSSQKNPIYEYQKPGLYTYKLYAFDANGCIDSQVSNGTVRVDVSPKADFDFSPGKGRMPNDNRIFFTDKSRSAIPLTYFWDFSDPAGIPATSTLQNATHDFSDSGDFKICLTVDNGGCKDMFCNFVRIDPAFPTPDFSVDRDSGCPPLTVQFTNLSVNSDRYIWFFGDGERSEDKDPVHTYKYSGYYDVILIAKGPGGEGKTEKKQFIKVLNAPYTYFNLTPSILYLPDAKFTTRNLTTGAVGYQWNVYNSSSGNRVGNSLLENPYFQVYDTGYYDVELISVSSQGCYDTLMLPKPIYVNPRGILHVPDAFTPTNDERNDVFKPSAINVQKDFYLFQIYNRWGEIVFETKDPNEGWDGRKKGKMCQSGVYVYKINARLFSGDDISADGVVHLIR